MSYTKEISRKTFIMDGESLQNTKDSTKKEKNMAGECTRILTNLELPEFITKAFGKKIIFMELGL